QHRLETPFGLAQLRLDEELRRMRERRDLENGPPHRIRHERGFLTCLPETRSRRRNPQPCLRGRCAPKRRVDENPLQKWRREKPPHHRHPQRDLAGPVPRKLRRPPLSFSPALDLPRQLARGEKLSLLV